jgi:lipopolysaccharide/colanic/teichoic acid biosynthesis glycosyltransferase
MTDIVDNSSVRSSQVPAFDGVVPRRNLLALNRVQLVGALLVAVLSPALWRNGGQIGDLSFNAEENTLVGTFLAMLFGAYLRHRLAAFPGQRVVASVVPAFGTAYGLDYSRFQFGASFALVLAWFGLLSIVEPHVRRLKLFIVPAGRAPELVANRSADWIVGRSPQNLPPGINGVVADLRADLAPEWANLLARAAIAGVPVYHWKQIVERFSGTVDVEHLVENTFGSALPLSVYPRLKRIVDLTISLLALPSILPMMAVVALAIRICDGGPVIFRQTRMGYRGKPFTILKFRTMKTGSENGERFTEANDPRITRLGRILRRYRFDELPQIINVIRGDMSWIGPRPESKELADWYQDQVPFYSYRYAVRPGITGWAQVHQGNVAQIEAATGKLRYDFYYIKYLSPWLDLAILLQTVRIILNGFGSR